MPSAVTDLEQPHDDLIIRAAEGDLIAFGSLYDEFADYVHGILRRHLGSSPHVEDLLQKVFVKVLRDLPEFRGDRPFRAWLRRACYFAVYDHLREEARRSRVPLDEARLEKEEVSSWTGSEPAPEGPEREYVRAEIRRATREKLARLTPEKQMAIAMHDFEGHTLDECGEILGVSRYTVRTRLVRGRRELAALVRKDNRLMQLIGRGGGER
ncbi:MAG: RNA polymerase sigma factor [Polyangia bacterium]